MKLVVNDNEFHGIVQPIEETVPSELVPHYIAVLHNATIPEVRFTLRNSRVYQDGRWPISITQNEDGSVDVVIDNADIRVRSETPVNL